MSSCTKTALLSVIVFAVAAQAICPGYSFGIGNQMPSILVDASEWNVYNDNCAVVENLIMDDSENSCEQGIFGCSPPPIIFDQYTSTTTGLIYSCRTDPNSDSCGSDTISVCCRNDGN